MQYADFIPPIIPQITRRLRRLVNKSGVRIHPFDCIPASIDPCFVLDIGANEGRVAEAALLSYPKTHVICFEPVKATFELLLRRLDPYGKRVTLINKALSDENGQCEINITSFHGANSISQQTGFHKDLNPHVFEVGKEIIDIIRLDDIADQLGCHKIDIMKIDVEGHELKALKGGSVFIKNRVDTIIIEMSFMRDNSWEQQSVQEIFSLLNALGFRLINLFDLHHAKHSLDPNMMCVQVDCVFRHISKLRSSGT